MEENSESVRSKIQGWLLGEGWQLAEKLHEDAVWLVEAQDSGGRHLVVGQKSGKPDQVLLEAAVAMADNHRERFELCSYEDRQSLLWDLGFRLLHLGVEFHGVQEPFTRGVVGKLIYRDGLSQDRFLQPVSQVRNGIIAVIWTVARHINPALGDSGGGEGGVN